MLKDVPFEIVYNSGETEPIDFFFEALLESKNFDLGLGFFSSSAINVLCKGFAYFIHNGGKVRIIINDILSSSDKQAILTGQFKTELEVVNSILDDIHELTATLSQQNKQFLDCLSYLIHTDKIEFLATTPINNNGGIAHQKFGIFNDSSNNKVAFNGSANFSKNALLNNIESISCYKSWEDEKSETERLKHFEQLFNNIWNGDAKNIKYITIDKVRDYLKEHIPQSSITTLLENEKQLVEQDYTLSDRLKSKYRQKVNYILKKRESDVLEDNKNLGPCFPFEKPREYQSKAYQNWVVNNYKGIFAMATGTGKTITSLNCVIEEYKKNRYYKFIVLVPTIDLGKQWKKEIVEKFNFEGIILCSSKNRTWKEQIKRIEQNVLLGIDTNFCLIATYATFRNHTFQNILTHKLTKIHQQLILIADEAHTMGAPKILKVLPHFISKRIGLSATPERIYDSVGESKLEHFFNSFAPKYTFTYNMKEAIEAKILSEYYYYPRVVDLNNEEISDYKQLTRQLVRYIDPKTGFYKEEKKVTALLIRRKAIIHKAAAKSDGLINIIGTIGVENLKYTFIYVPEGYRPDDGENDFYENSEDNIRIIDEYTTAINNKYGIKLRKFLGDTADKEDIIKQFSKGQIDALLAMKCLDEGIDIPQTKIAIFCSSTGNPRQYIQRRGRVLRYHEKKGFAIIYDLIVKPPMEITNTDFKTMKAEKSIVLSELKRIINFAALAKNKLEAISNIEHIASAYDIDAYEMLNLEIEKYTQHEIVK